MLLRAAAALETSSTRRRCMATAKQHHISLDDQLMERHAIEYQLRNPGNGVPRPRIDIRDAIHDDSPALPEGIPASRTAIILV